MMTKNQREKLERDLVCDIDGYYYFLPKSRAGHFPSWYLRAVADILDAKNKPWDDEIKEKFGDE